MCVLREDVPDNLWWDAEHVRPRRELERNRFLIYKSSLWGCLWFLWWDDKDCCCHHGKYLWILKILVNIENIGEFGKYWKSCLNIENHGDYLWIPKIMAIIFENWKSGWRPKLMVNICSFHSGSHGPCLCWRCTQIHRFLIMDAF